MEFNNILIGVNLWNKRFLKSCLFFPIDFNRKIMTSTDDSDFKPAPYELSFVPSYSKIR